MDARPYTCEIALRWADMDAFGHVNNVDFLRLLEQARVVGFRDWFAGTGINLLATGIVVARHEIEYLAPLEYRRAPVAIDMWIQDISGASFELGYVLRDPTGPGPDAGGAEGAERVYCLAESTMVTFDFASGRARRLTDGERGVLGGVFGEPVPLRRRAATPTDR